MTRNDIETLIVTVIFVAVMVLSVFFYDFSTSF